MHDNVGFVDDGDHDAGVFEGGEFSMRGCTVSSASPVRVYFLGFLFVVLAKSPLRKVVGVCKSRVYLNLVDDLFAPLMFLGRDGPKTTIQRTLCEM